LVLAVSLALAGCAVPPVDRFILDTAGEPVRVNGAHGPLTRARSDEILANLKQHAPDSAIVDRHLAVEEAVAGSPLSIGNKAVLLEDGDHAYPAMLAAIHSARHSIHMAMYIFDDSQTGQMFAAALAERRKAGVEVRILCDGVGSIGTSAEFFKELEAQGIEVERFNPVNPGELLRKGVGIIKRDHRKLLVVDGRTAFLGGINISSVYGNGSSVSRETSKDPIDKRPWRDTQVELQGPVVADLQRLFVDSWAKQTHGKPLEGSAYFPSLKPEGPLVVRAITSAPDSGLNPLYVTLVSAITASEVEVHITMAYFVPDPQLLQALEDAARRGVDVKIILPAHTDGWVVFNAGRSFYEGLLESGVKIYERKARVLHAKTATIDGVWSTVGSSNMDWRSLLSNEELNAVILGTDFAKQMDVMFDQDVADSVEITPEKWHDRSIADRMREGYARAMAYML
jgi:cardiolipin synthase A/B